MSSTRIFAAAVLVALCAAPSSAALGQDAQPVPSEAAVEPEPAAEVARLEAEARARAVELERLKAEDAALKAKLDELSARMDAAEDKETEKLMAETEKSAQELLSLYGFFDFDIYKYDTSKSPSRHGVYEDSFTFMVNRINLYLSSHVTETLSALAELRFTFLPLGAETSFAEPTFLQSEYVRVDTSARDPFYQDRPLLGGIVIERAQMTWQPQEFIGVTLGRWLTPYGIWNVDHASPVLIPISLPNLIKWEMLPGAQTGLMIHGRFNPLRQLYFDYLATVSNGRGL